MKFEPDSLQMSWPPPRDPLPVVIFGAGSIVRDAHLPAYQKSGVPVLGLYDPDLDKARKLTAEWDVPVFKSIDEAVQRDDVVFDLATPPDAHCDVLRRLPDTSPALIQKPMGRDLIQASEILRLCRQKHLRAAVNFQLRFAPMVLALKDAVAATVSEGRKRGYAFGIIAVDERGEAVIDQTAGQTLYAVASAEGVTAFG